MPAAYPADGLSTHAAGDCPLCEGTGYYERLRVLQGTMVPRLELCFLCFPDGPLGELSTVTGP